MYDERITNLINAALADGELTEKEKQILFKNAEAQGIDLDEFEMVLDAKLIEIKKAEAMQTKQQELELEKAKAAAQAAPSAPKSTKFGDIRKCPSCGAIVQSFQTRCEECGHEFRGLEAVDSARKLFEALQACELRKSDALSKHESDKQRQLEALSAKHNQSKGAIGAIVDIFGDSTKRNEREDEEREDLIRELNRAKDQIERNASVEKQTIIKNFPVPNTKEDLIELLAMSTSSAYDNDGYIGSEEEVWIQKTDQIYQKIVAAASNDKELMDKATNMIVSLMKRLPRRYKNFTRIPSHLVAKINAELEAEKQRKKEVIKSILLSWKGITATSCLLVAIIFLIIAIVAESGACGVIALILCAVGVVFGIIVKNAIQSMDSTGLRL